MTSAAPRTMPARTAGPIAVPAAAPETAPPEVLPETEPEVTPDVTPDGPTRRSPAPDPFEPDWPETRPLPPPKAARSVAAAS